MRASASTAAVTLVAFGELGRRREEEEKVESADNKGVPACSSLTPLPGDVDKGGVLARLSLGDVFPDEVRGPEE